MNLKLKTGMIINIRDFNDSKYNNWGFVIHNCIYGFSFGEAICSCDEFDDHLENIKNKTYINLIKYNIGMVSYNVITNSVYCVLQFIKDHDIPSEDWGIVVYKKGDKYIENTITVKDYKDTYYVYVDGKYKCINDFEVAGYYFKKDKYYYIKQNNKGAGVKIFINDKELSISDKVIKENFLVIDINYEKEKI